MDLKSNLPIIIPELIQQNCHLGLTMSEQGFFGGNDESIDIAIQLIGQDYMDIGQLKEIQLYLFRNMIRILPEYKEWELESKFSTDYDPKREKCYRNLIRFLMRGGLASYVFLMTKDVQDLLNKNYPEENNSLKEIEEYNQIINSLEK